MAPMVAVFHTDGDVTQGSAESRRRSRPPQAANPGSRVSSYFSTGSRAYVSEDGHTTFAMIYPPGVPDFSDVAFIEQDARRDQGRDARRA